jgi:hypothetical protein
MGKICNAPQKHDHHEMADDLQIRPLNDTDPPIMAAAFSSIGWLKPVAQFERYLNEQAAGAIGIVIFAKANRWYSMMISSSI